MNSTSPLRPSIEICFTLKLFPFIQTQENFVVVVTDILRASTSICTAIAQGVEAIIPVAGEKEARQAKEKGFLVASENSGIKHDFADFGNSAFHFMKPEIKNKTIVYNTTNGTKAILAAQQAQGCKAILIGAFGNLDVLASYLCHQPLNVVILCSGWKGKFCMEDALFAGALAQELCQSEKFSTHCDSVLAALMLWSQVKDHLADFIPKVAYYERMAHLGHNDVIPYSLQRNTTPIIPSMEGHRIVALPSF